MTVITVPARHIRSVYPDGSPLPPHTYDYVQYDRWEMITSCSKGQIEWAGGQSGGDTASFNLDTLRWRHGPQQRTAILNSGAGRLG